MRAMLIAAAAVRFTGVTAMKSKQLNAALAAAGRVLALNKAAVWFPISSSWTKRLARLLLLITPIAASPSHADLMSVDATGVVIQANPSLNPAHVGDTITLHGIFDSASLVDKSAVFGIPGLQFGSFAFGSNDALTIDMPGQHWSLTDEPYLECRSME